MKQLNLYRLVEQHVPCPIHLALNSTRAPQFHSNIGSVVGLVSLRRLGRNPTETINGDTSARLASSVQSARLARGLEGGALLRDHIFIGTTAHYSAGAYSQKLRQQGLGELCAPGYGKLSRGSNPEHG